ncbi:MAG: RNB domain-containing ribonuclease [Deltaproteobacteria bacterium]|nr:RNB domain-containing ribonuclease [Deltaproteobacteria bacterium]
MAYGKIIEYIDQGRIHCTLCIQDKGNKLHLLTTHNQQLNISPKRVLLVSGSSIDPQGSREDILHRLKQVDLLREKLKEDIRVKDLWELINGEDESFDYRYLAQLCFGEDVTDDHISALVRALFEDKLYFKMKDGLFVPCAEKKVEQTVRQRDEEALKDERLNMGSAWLKEALLKGPSRAGPDNISVIDMLVELAVHGKDSPNVKDGIELLSRAGIRGIEEARDLLVRLGVWEEDEPVDLYRFNIRRSFDDELIKESFRVSGIDAGGRADLRNLPVFTVDGPTTRDFDDALSIEFLDDHIHVGIHIADVAGGIPPDSPIDREAFLRGSSLYLPERLIPMLPEHLSDDTFSLLEGRDRPAISLLARFDMSGNLDDYSLTPSIIKVRRHWTYDDVNEIYDRDDVFSNLHRLGELLRKKRIEQGALILSLPDPSIEFDEKASISIKMISQETPSRMMVAEMMILYNWLAARFCRDNNIPILFRGQKEPAERLSLEGADYLYYVFMQRRKLLPLVINSEPNPHSGLGLDVYTNLTSPIRRYFDLVCQRQVKHFIVHGGSLYNKEELEKIRLSVSPVIKDLNTVKKNHMNYWILKYFQGCIDREFPAIILDVMKTKYRLIMRDCLYVTEMKREQGRDLKAGMNITVRIKKSDPREGVLKIEPSGKN